jgi:hypothetical protein
MANDKGNRRKSGGDEVGEIFAVSACGFAPEADDGAIAAIRGSRRSLIAGG